MSTTNAQNSSFPSERTTPGAGHEKRRNKTRSALLSAALRMLADERQGAGIREITAEAGVGFGSFFNHFPGGKDELYSTAVREVLDAFSGTIAESTADCEDIAEVFSRSFRLTGRLAINHTELITPILASGTELLVEEIPLRVAALEDIKKGIASGRFSPMDPEVHLASVGGALLGMIRLTAHRAAHGLEMISVSDVDRQTESVLRMLGLDAAEAADVVSRELPTEAVASGEALALP